MFSNAFDPNMAVSGAVPFGFQPDCGDWAVRGTENGWFELR